MTQLDPRSLIAMAGLMAALMAVVLYFMRRYYPPSIQGIGYWASAPLMWLVATVMFSGRGVFPDLFSMVVANTLLLLGTTAFYVGCRRFLGHGGGWRLWGTVAALSALVFAWLTYGHPSYPLRLGSFTALMICIYAANLRFLLCHGGKRFPVRLVEVVLALHIAVLAVRLSSTLVGRAGSDLMEPSLYQTLYIGAYVLTVLMLSIGAVLMATDRLTTELNHLATHDALTHTLNRRALPGAGVLPLAEFLAVCAECGLSGVLSVAASAASVSGASLSSWAANSSSPTSSRRTTPTRCSSSRGRAWRSLAP